MRLLLAASVLAAFLVGGVPGIAAPAFGPHVVYGIIKHVGSNDLVVERHTGQLETVNIRAARAAGRTGVLYIDRAVALYGDFDRAHHYNVNAIMSANGIHHGVWPADQ
jgi:hypothetical protein